MNTLFNQKVYKLAYYFAVPFALIFVFCFAYLYRLFFRPAKHPRLVWGPIPIINNKYWSDALRGVGFDSKTMMFSFQSEINKHEDFDIDIERLMNLRWQPLQRIFNYAIAPYVAFAYSFLHFDIFHHSFHGGFLGKTPLRRFEAFFLRVGRKKTVILAYGEDAYVYSQVLDPSLKHVLLKRFPLSARDPQQAERRIAYWVRFADIIVTGFIVDGMGRWDILPFSHLIIDSRGLWKAKQFYNNNDGRNGAVRVIHTPSSRDFKGTEFLIQAIEELRRENLDIELILVEKRQNDEVRNMMMEADILAEQFIVTGYGLNGIEGMATGLPVMANLQHEAYTRLFRRYSYLNECPVLSSSPETLKENLRILVTNPGLREDLGRAGRQYVEKYHSETTAQYMFGSIYDKIWYSKEVDLMNLFHPLLSEYNLRKPVRHPLVENQLPASYFADVATFVS